jgi:hypothetical protein
MIGAEIIKEVFQMKRKAFRYAALALALTVAMAAGMMVSNVMAESNVTATPNIAPVTVVDTNPAI